MAEDKTDIWLPIYVGDYLADTMHLTTEQHGAYFLLILAYWKNRGKLANSRVQGIVRMDKDSWTINRGIVEELFDTKSFPGFWYHKRIEKELQKALIRKQAAENRGKKGMESRWGNKGDDSSTNSPTIVEGIVEGIVGDNSSPSPSPSYLKKEKKRDEPFDLPSWIPQETWNAYLEVRNKKRATKSTYALNLIIKELLKIKEKYGQDPITVLNKSIKSGWIDVFPIKDEREQQQGSSRTTTTTKLPVLTPFPDDSEVQDVLSSVKEMRLKQKAASK